jgi:IS4 transposase
LDLPEHLLVTDTRTSDRQGFDQAILDEPTRLERLRGQTLAIDLGYYGHARFARLRAARVHFVSRLNLQASYQLEADIPIQQPLPDLHSERIRVVADQRITLGSAANSQGAVLAGLRLVTAEVCPLAKAARRGAKTVRYQILTDRWDLGAADVIQLYLWRWQIELFLRWLKSHVHLPRLLGYSPNAVELTVWLAIVIHLLTVLAASALGWTRRSPTLLSQLPWALAQLTAQDDEEPTPLGIQLALPMPEWTQTIDAPT